MNTLAHIQHGLDAHKERAFDLLRIYLGLGLFVRGVLFIADSSAYAELISGSATPTFESAALMHYVALAHLGGGLLMALGLLTRLAALIQIPILAGAVFFVHLPEGLTSADQSLEFAALVLVLLVLVFIYGSGKWSVDYYLLTHEEDEARSAPATRRREAVLNRIRQTRQRPQTAPRKAKDAYACFGGGARARFRPLPLRSRPPPPGRPRGRPLRSVGHAPLCRRHYGQAQRDRLPVPLLRRSPRAQPRSGAAPHLPPPPPRTYRLST